MLIDDVHKAASRDSSCPDAEGPTKKAKIMSF